ncbi:hypothetical protein Pfo_011541 [Paulownia fortunei]|nr:hypothetical protein Pfo_011541 [Paulownia fortunei]
MRAVGRIMIDKMMIFATSFSRREQNKLACGAFIGCFIIAVTLSTVFKPYLAPLPICKLIILTLATFSLMKPIICNFSNSRSDVYEINGDVRIHGMSSTIFIASSQEEKLSSWTIKPYARKGDTLAMGGIPHCNQTFSTPAIIFSTGGYAGNHFHAFTDVLVPLFLTSQQFNRTTVFLVTDNYSGWTSKYKVILEKLSKYDIYDIDKENQVLCFSRMIIGLKAHKEFTIDPSEFTHYSMRNFTKMLRSAYSLERESVNDCQTCRIRQPRMLIICRKRGRYLVNKHAIADMARSLGFDVVLKQMVWNVSLVAQLVNSFDVMVGVHGAGLTNMVFLPENAIIIQIIPFGLDFLAKTCFQIPAENMNLRYLEYKTNLNESSLSAKYSLDTKIYTDPAAINKKGFDGFRSVYLDNQDINLDLGRFRKTLLRALECFHG